MEEQKKPLILPLQLNSDLVYKMIIPESVEKKIRFLCREIHNIEWSGVLFYDIEGSFENNDLVIKCLDIYQMDIGNGAYTEYTMNPSVATYMLDHDLITAYQGHIHSHHNMSTFFSGTDTRELQDGGKDTNHFVSLIVNNAGTYTAGVTRRILSQNTITEKCSYNTFGDETKEFERTYDSTREYLEWYKLQIEVQGKVIPFETEMLARIKEIRAEKQARPVTTTTNYQGSFQNNKFFPEKDNKPKVITSNVVNVSNANMAQKQLPFEEDIPYGSIHVDNKIIQSVIKQMITCSVILPSESVVDIDKWVKAMNQLYTKRFGTVKVFEEFAVNYLDFLINNTKDESLVDVLDNTDMGCILAYELLCELEKYPKNPWLEVYLKLLDEYIL